MVDGSEGSFEDMDVWKVSDIQVLTVLNSTCSNELDRVSWYTLYGPFLYSTRADAVGRGGVMVRSKENTS